MKNINWITSYPKSGNTMVRLFLCAYFFTKDGTIDDLKISKAIKKFNTIATYNKYKKLDVDYYNSYPYEISKHFINVQKNLFKLYKENVFFFKTHNIFSNKNMLNFTNENITRSVIYIVRDPRSVLISKTHHFNFNSQNESLKYMINETRFSLGSKIKGSFPEIISSWGSHYKSWKKFINETGLGLIVKYENLVNSPEAEFKKILNHLARTNNFIYDEIKFQNSLKSINFKNLQSIEEKKGFDERTSNTQSFFRKGKVDEWHDKLEAETANTLIEYFSEELKELNYL